MNSFRRSRRASRWSLTLLLVLLPALAANARVHHSNDWARTQFTAAERMREALNGRPAEDRSRREYQRVINSYRRIYFGAPASSKADASVVAVAELMVEMGRHFDNATTLRGAIKQYEFLRREYPGSKYRFDALFTIGEIYQDDLNDQEKARGTFNEFLRRYPRHRLAEEARNSLHEPVQQASLLSRDEMDAINPEDSGGSGKSGGSAEPIKNGKIPRVTAIRHWSTPDYTRVAIDVEQDVKYESQRIDHPDRIFFDLLDTKIASTLVGKSFDVDDGFLKKIRIAQFQPGKTRVVLEVDNLADYDAFLLPNPSRLIIDIHGKHALATVLAKATHPVAVTGSGDEHFSPAVIMAPVANKVETKAPAKVEPVAPAITQAPKAEAPRPSDGKNTPAKQDPDKAKSSQPDASKPLAEKPVNIVFARVEPPPMPAPLPAAVGVKKEDSAKNEASKFQGSITEKAKSDAKKSDLKPPAGNATASAAKGVVVVGVKKKIVEVDSDEDAKPSAGPVTKSASPKAVVAKLDVPVLKVPRSKAAKDSSVQAPDPSLVEPAPLVESQKAVASGTKSSKKSKTKVTEPQFDVREAQPTASGDRSLIRALGLKIGKIVIDPGHGGHDAGTIGPGGLKEKDLVLDVSRRLGKLLESRLGAEVVYTRDDDTFIPLETRTAIANQEQSDLFVSIHANSSRDPDARGVETYYLNFTSSSEALEVAARENAVSEKSIHELQDLVKKIALKEKIEESREFASDVQRALHTGLSTKNPGLRNRGVKKAPFIVLIGANMPSILAEISFVSNPGDERKLETPEYRQKIAESLYRGISKYVGGLSGVKVASKMDRGAGQ